MRSSSRADSIASVIFAMIATLSLFAFAWLLFDLSSRVDGLSMDFLISAPGDSGRAGGIGPMIVSTLLLLAVCLAVTIPAGVGTAILLSEFTRSGTSLGRFIRTSLDALAAVPSIVFGLFGSALFSKVFGLGFSILAGGLTLACMALPLFIRTAEAGLRSVPDDYRRASLSLGISKTSALVHVLLPAALPALMGGVVLSIGRAVAETAALMFTSGYVDRMPGSLLDSGRSLSIHIYDLSMNVSGGDANAARTALVLVFIVLILNGASAWLSHRWTQKTCPA